MTGIVNEAYNFDELINNLELPNFKSVIDDCITYAIEYDVFVKLKTYSLLIISTIQYLALVFNT